MPMKLRPTNSLQAIVATMLEEGCPNKVSLVMLATVIFVFRPWLPGKNIKVVLEVKYNSASCAYSESVAQWVELGGQDEHAVAVGMTQYTFSAEKEERVLISVTATRIMVDVD